MLLLLTHAFTKLTLISAEDVNICFYKTSMQYWLLAQGWRNVAGDVDHESDHRVDIMLQVMSTMSRITGLM